MARQAGDMCPPTIWEKGGQVGARWSLRAPEVSFERAEVGRERQWWARARLFPPPPTLHGMVEGLFTHAHKRTPPPRWFKMVEARM